MDNKQGKRTENSPDIPDVTHSTYSECVFDHNNDYRECRHQIN